jgi:hypothetical protein
VLRGVDHVLLKRTADNPDLHRLALKARQLRVEAGSVEDAIGGQGLKAAEIERIRALGEAKTEETASACSRRRGSRKRWRC